jgi:hypothetical protein
MKVYSVNKLNGSAIGKTIAVSDGSPWRIGEAHDYWALKQIKFISEKQADEIMKHNHYQIPKLTVDFDGTLFSVSKNWPEIGKQKLIHKFVANYVRRKHKQGWIVILNTMRENGKGLEQAKEACEKFKIPIDLYNENYQPDIDRWGDSRKIGTQLSIDDTQIGLLGWLLRRFR